MGPAVATGTTAGGRNDFELLPLNAMCSDAGATPDVAFSWIAPAAGTYTFDTLGSAYDTVIGLVPDSCSGLLGCNDDVVGGPLQSSVGYTAAVGERIYVVVTGFNASAGAYQLNITPPPTCPGAVAPGSLGSAVGTAVATGTTAGGADDFILSCGGEAADVVFSWIAPSEGVFVFDTNGSAYDTVLELRAPDCQHVSACDDDVDTNAGTLWSSVPYAADAGELIYIVLSGYNETGAYQLNVTAQ
jgi:hypothetical protein